jgi:predicted permease
MKLIAQDMERAHSATNRGRSAGVHTQFEMRTQGDDINWKFAVIFSVLGMAVLLVACANVAGLLLSRSSTRTREIAVRLSLGAGRFRLIRLLLVESLVLALLGGLGGIAVGYGGIRFLQTFQIPSELPVQVPFRLDTRMLIVALLLALASAVVCGLVPALQSARTDLVTGLKSTGADGSSRKRLWGRNALVVAQVACSLMLLAASFLMARGFEKSFLQGIGFPKDRLLMARFDPRLARYDATQTSQFYERLTERARALPGVRQVALTRNPPLGLDGYDSVTFIPSDFVMPRDRRSFTAFADYIDDGYFDTFGIPILRGRAFRRSDTATATRVAIVNRHFAQRYWPNAEAIGKTLQLDGPQGERVEVIGVAQDIKYEQTMERPREFVYLPVTQQPKARLVMMMKTSGDPLGLTGALRETVRGMDPNMPVIELRTYEDLYRYNTVDGPQVAIKLVGSMGTASLFLAVAGLYGLMAYNVARKTREIGIRLAIGASPGDVLRLVMGKGLRLVAVGAAIGLVLGFGVERMMNSMVFNAGPVDIAVYVTVVPLMLAVAMLAAYVPARRAARIAPTQALRHE